MSDDKPASWHSLLAKLRNDADPEEKLASPGETPQVRIDRMLIDMEVDGAAEWVEVRRNGDSAQVRSSLGEQQPVVDAILGALAASSEQPETEESAGRLTPAGEPTRATRDSTAPPAAPEHPSEPASALDDYRTAIVRAGLRKGANAPGVMEAHKRLLEALGEPVPWGAARWLMAVRRALLDLDAPRLAELFEGAERVAQAYRQRDTVSERFLEEVEWLTPLARANKTERISDRRAVEVARRWVGGLGGQQMELRYLLCLNSGEVYRELGERDGQPDVTSGLSEGPCPRAISIGLADLSRALGFRRITLLQYTVSSEWSVDLRRRLHNRAEKKWPVLLDRYRRFLENAPGLFEAPVLLSPARLESHRQTQALVDASGELLSIDDPVRAETLAGWCHGAVPSWVFGTLGHQRGALTLTPLSAFIDNDHAGSCLLL